MNKNVLIIIAFIAIAIIAFAGLAPLPGQKDKVTAHSEPAAAPGTQTR
jgi:hypothetical protein